MTGPMNTPLKMALLCVAALFALINHKSFWRRQLPWAAYIWSISASVCCVQVSRQSPIIPGHAAVGAGARCPANGRVVPQPAVPQPALAAPAGIRSRGNSTDASFCRKRQRPAMLLNYPAPCCSRLLPRLC